MPPQTDNSPIQLPSQVDRRTLAQTLVDQRQQAERQRASTLTRIKRNRKLVEADQKRTTKPWKNACELHMPIIKIVLNRLLAQLLASIFDSNPIVSVEGVRAQDEAKAPVMEEFTQGLLADVVKLRAAADQIFRSALVTSVGVSFNRWKRKERTVTRRELGIGPNGPEWQYPTQAETLYDAPVCENLPIEHVGWYPANVADLDDALGVYLDISRNGSQLLQLRDQGFFDPQAVASIRTGSVGEVEYRQSYEADARKLVNDTFTPEAFQHKPFDISIFYWEVPVEEDAPTQRWELWIHPATWTILRAVPNPAFDDRYPITLYRPFPDSETLYGDSLGDIIGDLQETMTTILRQTIDQAAIDINPPVLFPASAYDENEKKNYVYGPGAIWRVISTAGISQLTHPSQVNIGINVQEFLYSIVQRATGVNDQSLGMRSAGAGTPTATESQMLASNTGALFGLIIDRFREAVNETVRQLVWLCYEHAGNEAVQNLWSKLVADPGDPAQQVDMNTVLGGQYRFSAAGSTETSNRELRKAMMRELYDRLMVNPLIASNPLRMFALTRRYLAEMGFRIPDELLGKEQEVKDAMASQAEHSMNMLGQEAGGQMMAMEPEMAAQERAQAPQAVNDAMMGMAQGSPMPMMMGAN